MRAALATANQASWFAASAAALGGSAVATPLGLMTRAPALDGGDDGAIHTVVLHPLDGSSADVGAFVDRVIGEAREDRSIAELSWWAGDSGSNRTLGTSLLARGFSWGFQPGWMHLDPARDADLTVPDLPGVTLAAVTDDADWDAPDLPYYDRRLGQSIGGLTSDRAAGTATAVFAATADGGRVIGVLVVHAQPEDAGRQVAGIYHCGVDPAYRRRGIGRALTATAARWAVDLGCTDLTLNATPMGAPVYRAVGFRPVGAGQTWWLYRAGLDRGPAPAEETWFIESIGRGTLDDVSSREFAAVDLDAQLWCGRTAVEVAALLRDAASARRLAQLGATVDLISAWDLGWRDEVPELLRARPDLVDRRGGEHLATPLHIAVERNDRDLFDLVIAAGPDLTITDRTFGGTPLSWAIHIGRPDLAAELQ